MYGPDAVSEQSPGLAALAHVPAAAVVLADANFGVFFFASELPANAALKGWLIVCPYPQRPHEKLYLFTTLEGMGPTPPAINHTSIF